MNDYEKILSKIPDNITMQEMIDYLSTKRPLVLDNVRKIYSKTLISKIEDKEIDIEFIENLLNQYLPEIEESILNYITISTFNDINTPTGIIFNKEFLGLYMPNQEDIIKVNRYKIEKNNGIILNGILEETKEEDTSLYSILGTNILDTEKLILLDENNIELLKLQTNQTNI